MDLYEHQARELFEEHGIVVPRAEVTDSPKKAREIARRLGGRVVVKAQVRTGGRGKAGGVKLAADPAAAELTARQMLGMDIKGHTVGTVMLARPVDIEEEFYVSYVLDRAAGRFLAIASAEGGMDIEEVAATRPEAVARVPVDPAEGVTPATASRIAEAAGLPPQTVDVLVRLWEVLVREDALLVEVNPLVRTRDGRITALDGKVTLDDNASFRRTRRGPGTKPPRTRSRPPRPPRASPTSSSTARSASSATAPDSSWPPSTWWPAAVPAPPTSSTSAAAPRRRSWRTACRSSSPTRP